MRLTQRQFEQMTREQKTHAFFSHESNTVASQLKRPPGPAYTVQAAFWNDWQRAFADFQDRLPAN